MLLPSPLLSLFHSIHPTAAFQPCSRSTKVNQAAPTSFTGWGDEPPADTHDKMQAYFQHKIMEHLLSPDIAQGLQYGNR